MTNKIACEELALFMSRHKELNFDMGRASIPKSCGTPGCIGGFAGALWPEIVDPEMSDNWNPAWHDSLLAEKLSITFHQVQKLCYPADQLMTWDDWGVSRAPSYVCYGMVTRKGAIATLRRLAKTGEVKWLQSEQEE
jgi:hypothetical protein